MASKLVSPFRPLLLGLAAVLGASRVAGATSTPTCGSLSDATWTPAGSPYVVCATGAVIPAGATITVQPGVVVQFQPGGGNVLAVQGTLVAVGLPDQPITFTGATASPGSWGGLSIDGSTMTPAVATLRSVVVEYGGVNGSYGAAISVDRGVLTLAHAIVRNSAGSGVYVTTRATPAVDAVDFTGNGLDALRLVDPSGDLPLTNLTASGNGLDAIHVTGLNTHVAGQRRWMAPGLPWIVDTILSNANGDLLTIDPGNEFRFGTNYGFQIAGRLDAVGTPTQPIVMKPQTPGPGGWRGILVDGGGQIAISHLEYVTLEDGGGDIAGANLEVMNGQVIASHDVIRGGRLDGVLVDSNGTVSIQNSQVTGNGTYGIENHQPSRSVLATDNWWGDPSGPQSDLPTCPSGTGQRITAGVVFRPVLTDPAGTVPVPLSAVPMLTMEPRRWFVPADGQSRLYVDLTLRDGNGSPLAGRTVRLTSTLGTVVDGGITDADGKTLAYVTASSAGDATLQASLDAATCENALSPTARVTFTTPVSVTELFPDSPAPYLGNGIQVSPMPVVAGVTTTITATLTNPLPSPITVDVSFGYVQASVGLAFGPIANLTGQVIQAQGTKQLSATFVPPVSGHYCVEVTYSITAVGPLRTLQPQGGGSGRRQLNLKVYQPPTGPPKKQDGLKKTRIALHNMDFIAGRGGNQTKIQLALLKAGIDWDLDIANKIDQSLQGDPPRQDFTVVDQPQKKTLPPVAPDQQTSAAMAAAVNDLADALRDANADGIAADVALDRAGGASEAMDLQWASTQQAALLEFNRRMGTALGTVAAKIDALLAAAANEGVTSEVTTAEQVMTLQQALTATGFDPADVANAHTLGLTDADVEDVRQRILADDPDDLAGDLVVRLQELRDQFLGLGDSLAHPEVFQPGLTVTGGAGLTRARAAATAPGNTLIHVYEATATFVLGNPLGTTTAIDVVPRRISLPADWVLDVSPSQVTLAPGEQATVTARLAPGAPIPQESVPRVAVEGWTGSQLLGGVTIEFVAPHFATVPCASITECYTALGTTLPDPTTAADKKTKRTALNLQKRYRALGRRLTRAAGATAKKRARLYKKARKLVQAVGTAAQHADDKGRLGVPLAAIQAAVTALVGQLP